MLWFHVLLFCWYPIHTFCFNIETRQFSALSHREVQNGSWFGYEILVFPKSHGIVELYVGAPRFKQTMDLGNGTLKPDGAIYKCLLTSQNATSMNCSSQYVEQRAAMGISLSGARNSTVVACGSRWSYFCKNAKLPERMVGVCYEFNSERFSQSAPKKLSSPCITDCPGGLDIMFLLDGSGSVYAEDFLIAKEWLVTVMEGFRDGIESGEVNVGMIQYSGTTTSNYCDNGVLTRLISYELRLGSYNLTYASEKVRNATHLQKCTLTGDAINATVEEFLERGRMQNAAVMIVITDGRSYDNVTGPSDLAKKNGISLIAVGVGSEFERSELEIIADNNESIFTVSNYSNLVTILIGLQDAIRNAGSTNLEGSQTNTSSNLTQCIMGFSTYYSKENDLHIGAVGAYDNKGTVISRPSKNDNAYHEYEEDTVNKILKPNSTDSYLGYSITSGYFTGGKVEWIVTGIPRYNGYGAVILYQYGGKAAPLQNRRLLKSPKIFGVRQIGSYFGHSACAVDLNKDGADDLIVGAPLSSSDPSKSSYDEGCVFGYMGNASDTNIIFEKPDFSLHGTASASRFGMTVTNTGDLDRDGFNDIAIGAPTANGLEGELYIYYGDRSGVRSVHQKISAKNLGVSLQYFGTSMAIVSDRSITNIPIIYATSPGTQNIIALQARPVVRLVSSLTIKALYDESTDSFDVLDCARLQSINLPCLRIIVCFRAIWNDLAQMTNDGNIEIQYRLMLDSGIQATTEKRMHFKTNDTKRYDVTILQHQVSTTEMCYHYSAVLKPGILQQSRAVDFRQPLNVLLVSQMSDRKQSQTMSPIFEDEVTKLEEQIGFARGCSTTRECSSDLMLHASMIVENPVKIETAGDVIRVDVILSNMGDPAFFTKIHVEQVNVYIVKVQSGCGYLENNRHTISYKSDEFGSIFLPALNCSLTVFFTISHLTQYANVTSFYVKLSAYSHLSNKSVAVDKNPQDNIIEFRRNVLYRNNIQILSTALPSSLDYWRNVTDGIAISSLTEEDLFAGEDGSIENSYKIINNGPFPLLHAELNFKWPALITAKNLPVLYLYEFLCQPSSLCVCNTTQMCNNVNPWKLRHSEYQTGSKIMTAAGCDNTSGNAEVNNYVNVSVPKNPLFTRSEIICKDINGGYDCAEIDCFLENVKPQIITVTAKFKMWIPTFSIKKGITTLYIGSSVTYSTSKSPVFPQTTYKSLAITATTQHTTPEVVIPVAMEHLNIILVLVGMGIGLLLLAILVLICCKCGFFKSKYKLMKEALEWNDVDEYVNKKVVFEEDEDVVIAENTADEKVATNATTSAELSRVESMNADKMAYLQSTRKLKKKLSVTGMIEYQKEYSVKTNEPQLESKSSANAARYIERHSSVENPLPISYGKYTPGKKADGEDYQENYYCTPKKLKLANGSRKIVGSNSTNVQPSVEKPNDDINEDIYLVMTPATEEKNVVKQIESHLKSNNKNRSRRAVNLDEVYDSPRPPKRRPIPPVRKTSKLTTITSDVYDIPRVRKVPPKPPVRKTSEVTALPNEVYDSPVPFRLKYRSLGSTDQRPTVLALPKSNSDLMKLENSYSTSYATVSKLNETVEEPSDITAEPIANLPENKVFTKRSSSYQQAVEKNPGEIKPVKAEQKEETSLVGGNSDTVRSPDYSYVLTRNKGGKLVKGTVTISQQRNLKKND